ncbi:hypothetical protein [Archangium primigenium]|uniref:hypothetical protein n=1 Tax=[Archangium] primigenium TaxID=2792470 RepID=UPI00195EBAA6|nr:hypothetical protein [Archangium primigenium]MBM7113930.1 hypothetical protein [Archangium primigenium]
MKTTTKGGARWGPFVLGRRCKHAAGELGDIYEAVHVDTGAPALVMIPRPESKWRPRRDWRTRTFVQTSPPLLAKVVEAAPNQGRLPDLTESESVLLAGFEALSHDGRMRTYLTGGLLGRHKWWPVVAGLAVAGMALLVLGGCVGWMSRGRTAEAPVLAPVVHVILDSEQRAPFLTDGEAHGVNGIAYPLPDKPFQNQAKAPCPGDRDELAINGGCWVVLKRKPPCHKDQAEYQGECYLPVSSNRGARPPQSVSP